MLWGVVTGLVHCGVVLRWADVPADDAPRKVPEAFRGAVRWGGRRVEVRGRATRPQVRSIKPCSPSATCVTTNQMEQSGGKPRKRMGSIAHRVDHSLFATTSSKQQAAPGQAGASPRPRPRPSQDQGRGRCESRPGSNQQSPSGGGGEMDHQVRASGS